MGVSESEKSSIASSFVKQYYTLLNRAPCYMYNFYSDDSTFIHGSIEMEGEHSTEPVVGRERIKRKMEDLKLNDCRAKIKQIDCLETLADGLVIQVIGELSNDGRPMRRFLQTFVLAPKVLHDGDPQNVKAAAADKREIGYFVLNSIFRYQDDGSDSEFEDDTASVNANTSNESTENGKAAPEEPQAVSSNATITNQSVPASAVAATRPPPSNEPTENGKPTSEDAAAVAPSAATTNQTAAVTAPPVPTMRPTPAPSNEPKTWANMVRKAHPPSTSIQVSVNKPASNVDQQAQQTSQPVPVQMQQSPQQQQQQQQQPQQQHQQPQHQQQTQLPQQQPGSQNNNNSNNRRRHMMRKPNKPSGRQIKNRPRPSAAEKPVA